MRLLLKEWDRGDRCASLSWFDMKVPTSLSPHICKMLHKAIIRGVGKWRWGGISQPG